jgi:anti-anti-sigma factor
MDVTTRMQGGITIAAIAGSLDSITSPQAQKALDALVTQGAVKVAVDCSALDYISSAGLRVLLGLAKQLSAKGGSLRTFGLNQSVREVFEISGFSTIFRVFPGEGQALEGF